MNDLNIFNLTGKSSFLGITLDNQLWIALAIGCVLLIGIFLILIAKSQNKNDSKTRKTPSSVNEDNHSQPQEKTANKEEGKSVSKGTSNNASAKGSKKKSIKNPKRPPKASEYRDNKSRNKKKKVDKKTEQRIALQKERKQLTKELNELNKLRVRKSELNKTVQNTVPYTTELDNGVIEIEKCPDGKSYYSIGFSFEDINYSTLSTDEAKSKFLRYMDLINLFPTEAYMVQIILDNHTIDVDKLENTIKIDEKNDEFEPLRDEINEMMHDKIHSGNNHLSKERFMVLSLKADSPSDAYSKFSRLEGAFVKAFNRIGTKAKRLTTMERLALLHDTYRPDHVGEFNKDGRLDYKELQKWRISSKDYIAPDSFDFFTDYFMMGDKYGQTMFINMFPASLNDKFLTDLTDQRFDVSVSVNIEPLIMQEAIKTVNKQILDMQADKQTEQKKALKNGYSPDMINHNVEEALEDGLTLRNIITNENQKMYYASIVIRHTANSEEELRDNARTLQGIAQQHICQLRPLGNQQERGLKQSLPLGHKCLKISRSFTTENIACLMPFLSKELMQKNGFYYGTNAVSGNLIIFDRKTLMNSNGFILGTSGSGKSFSAKREMLWVLLATDDDLIVIDPEGEYIPFLKMMGGERIEISTTSPHHLNPLDLSAEYTAGEGDPITGKCSFMLTVIETAISSNEDEGLNAVQKAMIDNCLRKVYEPLIAHNYDPAYIPTFIDLQKIFDSRQDSLYGKEIAEAFQLFTTGSLSLFAHRTNVNIKHRFAIYDISKLDKQLNALGSLIMLDAVWNRVIENRKRGKRTWVYVDEFTVLLRRESSKQFFLDVFKRIRKYQGTPTGITQNITSLLRDPDAMEMLANAEFIYMLNQSATDRDALEEILKLSPTQLDYVTDSDKGCGIMKAGRNIVPFNDEFKKDTKCYEAMTTDPDERSKIDSDKDKESA